jgi:hypothetical protein
MADMPAIHPLDADKMQRYLWTFEVEALKRFSSDLLHASIYAEAIIRKKENDPLGGFTPYKNVDQASHDLRHTL